MTIVAPYGSERLEAKEQEALAELTVLAARRRSDRLRAAQARMARVRMVQEANRRAPVFVAEGDPKTRGLEAVPIWQCKRCGQRWHWPTRPGPCGFCFFADAQQANDVLSVIGPGVMAARLDGVRLTGKDV